MTTAAKQQEDVARRCFHDQNQRHPINFEETTCESEGRKSRLLSDKEMKKKKCLRLSHFIKQPTIPPNT